MVPALSSPPPGAPGSGVDGLSPPPGMWWRTEVPASQPSVVEGYLAEIRFLADATDVKRSGSSFRYQVGSGREAVSGDVHVERGRVIEFTFVIADPAWKDGGKKVRIDTFDEAPPVEPPPADKVVDMPLPEPCGPDGFPRPGQLSCQPTDGNPLERKVSLPAPSITGPSSLQLRPVRSVGAGSCPTAAENPAADQPARLTGRDGSCYDLGPASLTISRAEGRTEPFPGGKVDAVLTLQPADHAALRRLVAGLVGRQVAMVMFGRVQSAPTIHDPEAAEATIVVSELDPQTAADVISALAG